MITRNFVIYVAIFLFCRYFSSDELTALSLLFYLFQLSVLWQTRLHPMALRFPPIDLQPVSRPFFSQDQSEGNSAYYDRFDDLAQRPGTSDRLEALRFLDRVVNYLGERPHDEATYENFFQRICELGQDDEAEVRTRLLEYLPMLFDEMRKSPKLDPYVDRCLTPLLTSELRNSAVVRKAALDAIGLLLEQRLFSPESLKHLLVPTLFLTLEEPSIFDDNSSASGSFAEELGVETTTVICRVIGMQCIDDKEWIFQNFVPKYSQFLIEKPATFYMRKTALQIFGELARNFGQGFVEKFLVPHLVSLAKDAAWGVRKGVVEIFVEMAAYSSPAVRRELLVPAFMRLLKDDVTWVNMVAIQELGKLISIFAESKFSGLALEDGKIVTCSEVEDAPAVLPLLDEYAKIPTGAFMPAKSVNGKPPNRLDSGMMSQWDGSDGPKKGDIPVTAAAMGCCSSFDDLSSLGRDDEDYEMLEEDEETTDPFNVTLSNIDNDDSADASFPQTSNETSPNKRQSPNKCPSPKHSPSPNPLNYWQASMELSETDLRKFGILTPFGFPGPSSSSPRGVTKVEESFQDPPIGNNTMELFDSNGEQQEPSVSNENGNLTLELFPKAVIMEADSTTPGEELNNTSDLFASSEPTLNCTADLFPNSVAPLNCTADLFGGNSTKSSEELNNTYQLFDQSATECTPELLPDSTMEHSVSSSLSLDDDGNSTLTLDDDSDLNTSGPSGFLANEPLLTDALGPTTSSELNLANVVPLELVQFFVRDAGGLETNVSDYNRHRAKNFPAVAFTLGQKHWSMLRDTYLRLANDTQTNVRATLAASIHIIAKIVGPATTLRDLVPIFNRFKEDDETVRQGLLSNLSEFFEQVPPEARGELLYELPQMLRIDSTVNWRFRSEFASQCDRLCLLFGLQDINTGLSGLALTLCSDRIAEVRQEASRLTAHILGLMIENEWVQGVEEMEQSGMRCTEAFVADIVRGFARSGTSRRRITFARICEFALQHKYISKEHYCAYLLDHLTFMAKDQVPNVRLAVCRVLLIAGEMTATCAKTQVDEALAVLVEDEDADVARAARHVRDGDRVYEEEVAQPIDVAARGAKIQANEEAYFASLSAHVTGRRNEDVVMQDANPSSTA
ncbi:unnamed protein product, partial [Mesorhabditis spiculigera]